MDSINQFESPDISSLSKLNDIAKGRVVSVEWLLFSHAVHLSLAKMTAAFPIGLRRLAKWR